MASRRISTTNKRGFTLIELLIVIGLIALIGSAVLFINLDNYRGDSFRAERTTLVTLLGQARIDALDNVDELPHGLALFPAGYPTSYVLFEGTNFASSTTETRVPYQGTYQIEFSSTSPKEIVFEQLNGDSNYSGTITMIDPESGRTFDIQVNSEGGLSW